MNPVIVITGAGKGIGKEIALEFSKRANQTKAFSPKLVLCSRTQSDLDSLAAECEKYGAETFSLVIDIAKMQDVERLYSETMQTFGTVDCLINNAGVGRFKNLHDLTLEDYEYMTDVNLKGTFFLTQKFFKHMEEKRAGHIVFITSVAAIRPFEPSAIYCMSKYGQRGFVEVLRLYARKANVRVTDVLPGAVYTPMWGELDEQTQSRMMKPEDIAIPVVDAFLLPERTCPEQIVLRPIAGDI